MLVLLPKAYAQDANIINWLNTNAITIEDTKPDTPLTAFAQNVPPKFKDARIFGFGEATHNTKEFFDLKAKFFKYLVEQQGVRVFIMEESYTGAFAVNQWLAGGEGDARTLAGNLGYPIWRCDEVVSLLQWMKDFNSGKPENEQIRFYGMDNQFGYGIDKIVRAFVKETNINVAKELLAVADSCAAKAMFPKPEKEWGTDKPAKLQLLRTAIVNQKTAVKNTALDAYEDILHALTVLEEYVSFITNPPPDKRDEAMFNNVLWVLEQQGAGSKAFIWAHNAHINNSKIGTIGSISVGNRLKQKFGTAYYSVGFDFAGGKLWGMEKVKGEYHAYIHSLNAPLKNTYAELLNKAKADLYFMDITSAITNADMANFLGSNKKNISQGNGGYSPEHPLLDKSNYSEIYDGLIFVKNVSIPHYIPERVSSLFLVK